MGLRQVLGYLSEESGRDGNLLSSQERELLTNILKQTKASGADPRLVSTVESILSRAIGDTLLQRASEAAGRSLLGTLESLLSSGELAEQTHRVFVGPGPETGPRPPSPSGPGPGPKAMVENDRRVFLNSPPPPATGPRPPSPSGPGPHQSIAVRRAGEASGVAVQEPSEALPAQCVIFDEFLALAELQRLTAYTLLHEGDFQVSEVISPGVVGGVIDPEYRRSRVLMDLGEFEEVFRARIEAALPRALERLGMSPFPITRFESQITASNHGDFFRHHSDNAEDEIARRQLTYVYFFHREPKAFEGGELLMHDAHKQNGTWISSGTYKVLVPLQNQIVFFPSGLLHEITPIVCSSQAFADSRFTVNGWLHR